MSLSWIRKTAQTLIGLACGALLFSALSQTTVAQQAQLLFGTLSGAPKAVVVDSNGNLNVVLDAASEVVLASVSLGAAGVKLTGDGDGALTFLGLGDGSDEDLTWNLDDTANTVVVTSSTGVNRITLTGIGLNPGAGYLNNGVLTLSQTAPTVTGFGTTPSVPASNGTAAFTINVGTGGTASTGTITLPAATTAWVVSCYDVTTPASFITHQTGGTDTTATVTNYSRTTGIAIAWTASDILRCAAMAY